MRTLVHLSDLHFGTVRQEIVLPLLSLLERIQPDLVAVSGDLTQRARKEQFAAARDFLDAMQDTQLAAAYPTRTPTVYPKTSAEMAVFQPFKGSEGECSSNDGLYRHSRLDLANQSFR